LVVVLFDYLDAQDSEQRATARLRRVLDEQAPAMRDAVIQGFAFDAEDLARVSSPEVLDGLTRNALAIQLGDKDFAAEVFEDIRDQVIRAGERHHDLSIDVDLSPWTGASRHASTPLFVDTMRWEYTVTPKTSVRRFACVSDNDEYRELMDEVWQYPRLALHARERARWRVEGGLRARSVQRRRH
jgi:hypothetical protein